MRYAWVGDTLLGTNISPEKSILKGFVEGICKGFLPFTSCRNPAKSPCHAAWNPPSGHREVPDGGPLHFPHAFQKGAVEGFDKTPQL